MPLYIPLQMCVHTPMLLHTCVGGIVVSIAAFQAVDPGSIPGQRNMVSLHANSPVCRKTRMTMHIVNLEAVKLHIERFMFTMLRLQNLYISHAGGYVALRHSQYLLHALVV